MDLAQKEVDKPDSEGVFASYNEEITKLKRQIKGYEGTIARMKKKEGLPASNQVNSSPAEVVSSEAKAPQVEKPHIVRSYEKHCRDCGEENKDWHKADTYCPDCGAPYGNEEDAKKAEKCDNCESVRPARVVKW